MVSSKPSNAGFTLIELLIVVAITAILAAIALPGMERLIASQRINNRADQLNALFQFARAEAIRTNKPVLICPTVIKKNTATSNECKNFDEYNNGSGWQGFLAFIDMNLNGHYEASIDSSVRVVALNQNVSDESKIKVKARWEVCDTKNSSCQAEVKGSKNLGFMPNGQFGIGYGEHADNWVIGQSSYVIELLDSKYAQIKRRIVISPSGKPFLCIGQNDIGNTNTFCTMDMS